MWTKYISMDRFGMNVVKITKECFLLILKGKILSAKDEGLWEFMILGTKSHHLEILAFGIVSK